MKIYLACTVRGDRGGVGRARHIRACLEAAGHEVLTAHLLEDDVEDAEGRLTDEEIFRRDLGWLHACDAIVAEASGSSFGVGFEVGYVLARAPATGQRVFLLYDAARRSRISRLIPGNVDPHCRVLGYTSPEEIADVVARELDGPGVGAPGKG
jgi:nucleoside 2-deoxyribosyltransferase